MADYDNTNRGSIWKNEKKETDKHPDFTGSQNVCCPKCGEQTDYWLSAWRRKEGASPKAPALSLSVKPKDGKPMDAQSGQGRTQSGQGRPSLKEEMSDDIPF
jgi:hypothetical protein